jgi:hypothetical protein
MACGSGKPHNRCTNALTTARDEKSFALHISAQIIGAPPASGGAEDAEVKPLG